MTRLHADNYTTKHSNDRIDPQIADAIKHNLTDGKITCEELHTIGIELNKSPAEMGKTADMLEIKIYECQLGLFGTQEPKLNIRLTMITPTLKKSILEATVDGLITCADCWDVCPKAECNKLYVAGACDALKVKIHACQLGAF